MIRIRRVFWCYEPFRGRFSLVDAVAFCGWNSHQTLALQPTTHCPILFPASFPFTGPFVWVSVSSVVCRQASIVSNHCSLLTQGPRCSMFPWPPSPRRTEGWNRSPGPRESLFALPFLSLPWCSCSLCAQGWVAAWSKCVFAVRGCLDLCVCSLFDA